jgi:hypothetical protein
MIILDRRLDNGGKIRVQSVPQKCSTAYQDQGYESSVRHMIRVSHMINAELSCNHMGTGHVIVTGVTSQKE